MLRRRTSPYSALTAWGALTTAGGSSCARLLAVALFALTPAPALAQGGPSEGEFPEQPAAPPEAPEPAPETMPAPAATAAPVAAPSPPPEPPPTYEPPPPAYEAPPPPPERPDDSGGGIPGFSIRIDPFNWLIEGQLGLELEVELLDFMTAELVPVFVTNSEPPSFNFSGRDDPLSREAVGIGPIAGSSIGVGFWLGGKALRGYVLRAILTNYSYRYAAEDDQGRFDSLTHVERQLFGYFGSHSRWGAFTLAGGIGLGVELNQQERCFFVNAAGDVEARTSDCDGELQIKLDRDANTIADLAGPLGSVQLMARFSLGVSFE